MAAPRYGSRPVPQGTMVRSGLDNREYLFGPIGAAYQPAASADEAVQRVRAAQAKRPAWLESPQAKGYDAATLTTLRDEAAAQAEAAARAAAEADRADAEMARTQGQDFRDQGEALAGQARAQGMADTGGELARAAAEPGRAAKTFARSAAVGAVDTAMAPVTIPARVARAAGAQGDWAPAIDKAADLSADEALQDATWLASGEEAGQYRQRVAQERKDFPKIAAAGAETGAALAMAPLAASSGMVQNLTKAERAAQTSKGVQAVRDLGLQNTRYLRDGMRDMTQVRSAYAGTTPAQAEAIATGAAPAVNSGKALPPVTVGVYPDGVTLIDGRHRMLGAAEAGAENIAARVRVYGSRGGLISETDEVLPIRKPAAEASGADYARRAGGAAVKSDAQDRQSPTD